MTKTLLTVFLLLVGLGSGFAVFVLLTSMAGITTFEWNWTAGGILYSVGLVAGPVFLILGSLLILVGTTRRLGSLLTIAGAAILTCWAVYLAGSIPGDQSRRGWDLRLIMIGLVVLVVVLASDVAAYRIYRLVSLLPPRAK